MNRPYPPDELLEPYPWGFRKAPEVELWLRESFLNEDSPLYNEEHVHLNMARIGVLWTNYVAAQHGVTFVGSAEIPQPRGRLWVKHRQEYQFEQWGFQSIDFLITLYAPFAAEVDDATFCALVEHEIYHCGLHHYTRKGNPVFTIRGHDVEEFVGIVKRYGAGAAAGATKQLVRAAMRGPTVADVSIRGVCGTCAVRKKAA
jgi:hypothetical protein